MLKYYFLTFSFAREIFSNIQLQFFQQRVKILETYFFSFFLMWLSEHWIDMFSGHVDINWSNDITITSTFS